MAKYAIVAAPSTLGLSTDGVEQLAGRLLQLGLAERIGAVVTEQLAPPARSGERDRETTIRNASEIAAFTPVLADAVERALEADRSPVLLGGDCTILLGAMLALRRRGRYGLLFIDGHADFFQPEAEPNGEGASMELAWATGHGPEIVSDYEGFHPLVRAEDVVAFGYRDHDDQQEYGSQPLPDELVTLDLPTIRALGIETAARQAVRHLEQGEPDGFFIHLDADVLDDAVMPAVDFRIAGGLSLTELSTALRIALASDKAMGLDVTIYSPTLDEDGRAGRALVDMLATALTRQA